MVWNLQFYNSRAIPPTFVSYDVQVAVPMSRWQAAQIGLQTVGIRMGVDVRVGLRMCLCMDTALASLEAVCVCAATLMAAQSCVGLGETDIIVYHMPARDTIHILVILCSSVFRLDVQQGVAVAGYMVVGVIGDIVSAPVVVKVIGVVPLPRVACFSFSSVARGLAVVGVREREGEGLVSWVCPVIGWVSALRRVCVGPLLNLCVTLWAPSIYFRF